MTINIKLDAGAIMPNRAHDDDAGYDLYARETKSIPVGGCAIFDTGVHIEIPRGYVGMVKSKSGLYFKHGLTGEGVVDSGYTGSIRVKLHNHGENYYMVRAGDKISQLVLLPIITPNLVLTEVLEESERGENGFGSTGI